MVESDETFRKISLLGTGRSELPSNAIHSSRFRAVTLLPRSLLEQFTRFSNVWFLLVAIFQLGFTEISPVSGWDTMVPLGLMLLLSLFKDAYLLYSHSLHDRAFNTRRILVWSPSGFQPVSCGQLLVGQLVLVKTNESAPADLLLLACSNSDDLCYINVRDLTGLQSIQVKKPVKDTQTVLKHKDQDKIARRIPKLDGETTVSQPNPDFNAFAGKLKLKGFPTAVKLNPVNLMPQKAELKAGEWVLGLVVYTGPETKASLNGARQTHKVTALEKRVNRLVLILLPLLLIPVLINAFLSTFCPVFDEESSNYFDKLVNFILLYNNIIPISLFVSLDLVRLAQSYRIHRLNPGISVRNTDVCEDMGQIEYMIVTKNGTLTDGSMHVKAILMGEKEYEIGDWEERREENSGLERKMSISVLDDSRVVFWQTKPEESQGDQEEMCTGDSGGVRDYLKEAERSLPHRRLLQALVLCHCLTPTDTGYIGDQEEVTLATQASSLFHYRLLTRTPETMVIQVDGESIPIQTLGYSPNFQQTKITRVLVQWPDQPQALLFIKASGAGLLDILNTTMEERDELSERIDEFQRKGLRTVMYACKEIGPEVVSTIAKEFSIAMRCLFSREDRIDHLFSKYEGDAELVGLVGLEETLLPDTKEAIEAIKQAGIQTWLASADSELSTLTTAFNTGLCPKDAQIISIWNRTDPSDLHFLLEKTTQKVIRNEFSLGLTRSNSMDLRGRGEHLTSPLSHLHHREELSSPSALLRMATKRMPVAKSQTLPYTDMTVNYCVSIDGKTLETGTNNQDCRRMLCCLLFAAKGVAFHSLLPYHKSLIVRLLREHFQFRPIILGVGSGQADLPLLTEANVGISVNSGVRADVAVERFPLLKELIIVQGRWCLLRTGKVVQLFIYKNVLLTVFLMAYNFFSDYQPPSLFPAGLTGSYNVLFTTIPVLLIGIWDEDLSLSQVLSHPIIYQSGIQGKFLRYRDFTLFLALALCQVIIISMTIVPSLEHIVRNNGETECFNVLGTLLFISIVEAVLGQVTMVCAAVTVSYFGTVFLCLVMLFTYILVAEALEWDDYDQVLAHIFGSGTQIVRLILAPLAAYMFGYAVFTYLRLFHPSVSEYISQHPDLSVTIIPWSRLSLFSSDLRRVYKSSSRLDQTSELHTTRLHPLTLHFSSTYVENAYQFQFSTHLIPLFRVVSGITVVLLAAWLVYNTVQNTKTETATSQSVMIAGALLVLLGSYLRGFLKHFRLIVTSGTLAVIVVKFLTEILFNRIGGLSTALIPIVTFGILNIDIVTMTVLNAIAWVLIAISLSLQLHNSEIEVLYVLVFMVLVSGIEVTCGVMGYYTARLDRRHFQLLNSVKAEAEHVRSILCCFLPEFVRDRVRSGVRYIAEEKGIVTVVFCDICEFDAICASSTPVELTTFLNELFQKFDAACDRNGVFKVETVGKTYMACAGLKDTELALPDELLSTTHARRAIELSFHILRIIDTYRLPNGNPVSVKIGINSGPVVAGVVGFHKPQFSLVGDTVNTASRMGSTIETPNTIQISEATYAMLGDVRGIHFEEHIVKGVKGKGDMKAYFVKERTLSLDSDASETLDLHSPTLRKNDESPVLRPHPDLPVPIHRTMCFRCCGSTDERQFRLTILKDTFPIIRTGLLTASIVRALVVMLRTIAYDWSSNTASYECLIAYAISTGYTFILAIGSTRLHQYRLYSFLVFSLCLISTMFSMVDFVYQTDYLEDLRTMEVMYGIMLLTSCSGLYYWWTVLGSVIAVVVWSAVAPWARDMPVHYSNLIFIVGFAVVNIYAAAAQERKIRSHTELAKFAEKEIQETDELLSHLLPPHVYESLKQERNITESFSNVTILFADIVGFTSWSSNKSPVEVVTMLSELFTQFDKLCVRNEVYKVHTIGDCYVAMGYAGEGVMRDIRAECMNVLRQAFDMVTVIDQLNAQHGTSLNMRIGIHTGEVIAGITGTSVVRYDIYGPDVLIANKMESGGVQGKVNVSDTTRDILQQGNERLVFEFNKEIEAKAVARKHKAYFVTALDSLARPESGKQVNTEINTTKNKEETMIAEEFEGITIHSK